MKKLFIKSLLIANYLILSNSILATNYFISSSLGNDNFTGISVTKPWRSVGRLNKQKLLPNDTVHFKCGDIFNGYINIKNSGTVKKQIVYTSYGDGKNPILNGTVKINGHFDEQSKLYTADINFQVYDIFINDKRMTPARYPNSGFISIDSASGKDSCYAKELNNVNIDFLGEAMLRARTIDWVYETRAIKNIRSGWLSTKAQNRYIIDKSFNNRTNNGLTVMYPFVKGYGFFLDGNISFLDTTFEWACYKNKLQILLQSKEQGFDVIAVKEKTAISIDNQVQYISISNIGIKMYEQAGIKLGYATENIVIQNCTFDNIHGCGILVDSAGTKLDISRNIFSNILGRGISLLEPTYTRITDNILHKIGLERAYGFTGVNGASGIVVQNSERKISIDTVFANNNYIAKNRVDSCGYIGIRVDGYRNLVELNVIDYCSLTLNDGANLYCFAATSGVTHDNIFRKNIIRNSIGDSKATPNNPNLAFGIYLDNNSHDNIVEDNIVCNTGATGILNNDAAYNNIIQRNLVANCKVGIGFAEWATIGKIHGIKVTDNIVVTNGISQFAISFTNWLNQTLQPGYFNNNTYINTKSSHFFEYNTQQFPNKNSHLELSFPQWQLLSNGDANSKTITGFSTQFYNYTPRVYINDDFFNKLEIGSIENAKDINGNICPSIITIDPMSYYLVFIKNE